MAYLKKDASEVLKQSGNKKRADSHFIKDIKLLLSQFKSPLMLLLIGAVVLSAFLGDTSDVFIILFIVSSRLKLCYFILYFSFSDFPISFNTSLVA
jgi:P-type Mg2+ transporter